MSSRYSYDIHGNVDTLLHHYRTGAMQAHGNNQFKAMAYNYDLISGKVNEVHYQPGMPDEFYHRYEYDAENRLTDVFTTNRKVLLGLPNLEEHDARYEYYKHGPLARTILGHQQVQGIDYAYTLQGWLKGVNSDSLLDKDGTAPSVVGRDAYRFSLNYFNKEYQPIGAAAANSFPDHTAYLGGRASEYRPLYNGNISSMVVGIPKVGQTHLYNYGYDQLNRIVSMDAWTGYNAVTGSWNGLTPMDAYQERVTYDANGNIGAYKRNGSAGQTSMDDLTYQYPKDANGNKINNRLRYVHDQLAEGNYTEDIDNQTALSLAAVQAEKQTEQAGDNYGYDAIGNLIKDTKEGISSIQWTVYGKIRSISKTDGTEIAYTYDVAGNRISKAVTKDGATVTTWYARDAQGNVMSVYTNAGSDLTLVEQHLYGSSRIGVWNRSVDMNAVSGSGMVSLDRGHKFFELSNHLGNVLVTVTDQKKGVDLDSDGDIEAWEAVVATANDYYPFGMVMPGRKFDAGSQYRYGFNGKELATETTSTTTYDYGFRIYSPALGRFLSIDPLIAKYPELTSYQFASNTPIQAVDLDGAESMFGWSIGIPPGKAHEVVQGWQDQNNKITNGTASGIKKSVQKTWSFITNDAWKASTWKNLGLFIEEAALDMSTVKIAPSPNIDAKAQDFKDNVLNGDAFTRSEYFSELGTDILLSKGVNKLFTVTKGMSLAQKINARTNFVAAKYASAIEKYGADHIDFTKPVSEVSNTGSLVNGKKLVQWRDPSNQNASPFFTYEGVDPSTLGIPKTYTQMYYVELSGQNTFLQSTANKVKAFSPQKDPGVNGMYNGGGTQLYSTEAAKTATFTPANQ